MSHRESVECGASPTVRVDIVKGDLRTTGTDGTQLEAVVRRHGDLSLRQEGDIHVITAEGDTSLRLPRGAKLEVVEVRNDLRVSDLDLDLIVGHVGGGAVMRSLAEVHIDQLGGGLDARDIPGALALSSAGGDVRLKNVSGSVRVAAGGDFLLSGGRSPLEATAGGDVVLQIELGESAPVSVVAGGDILCRLPASPSATISISNGGSKTIDFPGVNREGIGSSQFTVGDGGAEITLQAGGDVWIGSTDASSATEQVDDIGSRVAASVGKTLAEVEAGLSAMGAVMETVPEAEISTKVQKIVERAMRRGRRRQVRRTFSLPVAAAGHHSSGGTSDMERMKILKMVEEGKLSVEDAEKLFEALEA
jgi:hypothetical protein